MDSLEWEGKSELTLDLRIRRDKVGGDVVSLQDGDSGSHDGVVLHVGHGYHLEEEE